MSDRLAAAQAALNAGRRPEAIDHMIAAIGEEPARPAQIYRVLATQLYTVGRYADGEAYAARGLERHPKDFDLLNLRGVLLRRLQRQTDAVRVLEQAVKLNPKHPAAIQNLGNVLLDLNEPARAEGWFAKLARAEPRNSENHRLLGRCLSKQGKIEPALTRFRQAVSLKRDNIDAWLDLVGTLNEENRTAESEETLDKALSLNPGEQRLLEGKVLVMRRSGQARRAETFIRELLPANQDAAWLHYQLGVLISDTRRDQANIHFARAAELEPGKLDYAVAYVESLERTRSGDEGGHIEQAYQAARRLLDRRLEFTPSAMKVLTEVFVRVSDYESIDQIGDFRSMGRAWAEAGLHTAFLKQLARVKTDDDRMELVEQHRIWGRNVEKTAARRKINRPPPRPAGGRIRLGFMSSDLRHHPVGYFTMPLFDHVDRDRFDVFVYSYWEAPPDSVARAIEQKITAYNNWPGVSLAQAAQGIADDQLDILIELGGSTYMNKLEVMAYRPAPIQASWLGYPHSAGLETIDYMICDPHNAPARRELMIEKPMMMPKSWIALGQTFFTDRMEIREGLPQDRNGFITFGTANNPHKYTTDVLRAWARVVKATPDSRFAFIRPEGSSPSFRANIERHFAAEGVSADRLVWHAVRGAHLPFYNEIDITLDPFPLTGGTTTTEALWMGVPVVNLRGPAFYERLSASILTNSGVADMISDDLDGCMRVAQGLVEDRERRRELRRTLREHMRNSALGQTEQFAEDFYDMVARTVGDA